MAETPIFIDGFSDFSKGINSGIVPILLPRDQLSFAINTTMRGEFATHRPAYLKLALTYEGNIQSAFELGFFQGATFFTPDYGNPSLIASISGRLFKLVPDNVGGALVSEIPIPGGSNPPSVLQAWLWQSETWVITNDGISLPIFYDNITARRSLGNVPITVATTLVNFNSPAIGADVEVEITAPYENAVGIPVIIDSESYTVKSFRSSTTAAYEITLRQTVGNAAVNYTNPTALRTPSLFYAFVTVGTSSPFPFATPTTTQRTITLTKPYDGAVGDIVNISTFYSPSGATYPTTYTVKAISGFDITVSLTVTHASTLSIVPGAPISRTPQTWATLVNTQPFVSPGVGNSVTVGTYTLFPGTVGTFVYPPNATEEYEVTAFGVNTAQQFFITVTNVNAVAAGLHVAPQTISYNAYELPVGRMGVYGMGRNWISLADGRSFLGSDLVGTSSGTQNFAYRDAVLRVTENNFLAGGGFFIIPGTIGSITAMVFTATLDTSLGQGALQVGTSSTMFSCNAPVDRTAWQNLENPILTQSLIGEGPLGQNSTIAANSDTLFRTNIGLGSLILARREFATWGNVSISSEVERIVMRDNIAFLNYGSAVVFRNRLLMTSKPEQAEGGFFHQGLIPLNFDPVSSLAGKEPSIYEGLWTGINSLQMLKGRIDGVNRAFSFSFNRSTKKIELYEVLEDGVRETDFNGSNVDITWRLETGMLFKGIKGKGEFDLIKLIDGELYVAEVSNRVRFRVDYRSQFDPCWHLWTEFSICAVPSQTATDNIRKQNRVSLGLGKPIVDVCDPSNNRPHWVGEMFQFRITITGHCKFYGMVVKASQEPKPYFVKVVCGDQECRLLECTVEDDYDVYQMQDRFNPQVPPVIFNEQVFFSHQCPEGESLVFTGTLPSWITLDMENTRLVGAAGVFQGATQEEANIAAQIALNEFGNAAVLAGDLDCEGESSICTDGLGDLLDNVYGIESYVDGTVGNPNGPDGAPAFDGSFPFSADGNAPNPGVTGWVSGEAAAFSMDGNFMCFALLSFDGCEADVPQWSLTFGEPALNEIWYGEKIGGETPEGVYNFVSGLEAGPATLTIELQAGTTTPIVGALICQS